MAILQHAQRTRSAAEIEALDRLSRTRALTLAESLRLEELIGYQMLAEEAARKATVNAPIAEIRRLVSERFKIDPAELQSKHRHAKFARPRQVGMYLAHALTRRSNGFIGRQFGHRHPSTVFHAIRLVEQLRATDPSFDADVSAIENVLHNREPQLVEIQAVSSKLVDESAKSFGDQARAGA